MFQKKNDTPLQNSLDIVFNSLSEGIQPQKNNKLANNILMTLNRRQESIAWLISSRSSGKVRPRVKRILNWALVEILYMNGVPAPAVVDTAVAFSKKRHSTSEASFINAFLRAIVSELEEKGQDGLFTDAPPNVRFNLPAVLWERWLSAFGIEKSMQLAEVLQKHAKVILRHRTWPENHGVVPDCLIPVQAPEWAAWAELYTPASGTVSIDELMHDRHDFYIQDMATLLAPSLLKPVPGETIGDFCAAPGGKSLILGEMLQGRGTLFCSDRSEAKLPRLQQNLTGIDNAVFKCLDAALDTLPKCDGILLDVPCSNSGVIRRKPDVRSSFSNEKLNELIEIQANILENASKYLNDNGRIVYSTCSIEEDENMAQVNKFLQKHMDFSLVASQTIMPSEEHDGAFAALLQLK